MNEMHIAFNEIDTTVSHMFVVETSNLEFSFIGCRIQTQH